MSRCCAKPTQWCHGAPAFDKWRRWYAAGRELALSDEADDVLGVVHRFLSDRVRTFGAVDQDGIDVAGIAGQPRSRTHAAVIPR